MNVGINALDGMDSILWSHANGVTHDFAHSPFGSKSAKPDDSDVLPGFNGERLDPISQSYHIGNGYRTYTPNLMRFNAPDSWSPFGRGGLNQYAYCEGDPINRSDPGGHRSSGSALGLGIGLGILGLLGAVFTFGQSIAAAAAAEAALTGSMMADLLATGLEVACSMANIASTATRQADPEASRILGWVSFGLGAASLAVGFADSVNTKLSHSSTSGYRKVTLCDECGPLGYMKDTALLSTNGYCYRDRYLGADRLSIVGHGKLQADGTCKIAIAGREMDAYELKDFLDQNSIDYRSAHRIRLVTCFSADGGDASLGNTFAKLMPDKPVIAYKGKVKFLDPEWVEKKAHDFIGHPGQRSMVSHYFSEMSAPKVVVPSECSYFSWDYWLANYQPVSYLHLSPSIPKIFRYS